MSGRALVLLSGGIDSAVVAVMAAQQNAYVHFLSFDYGQANRKELTCARRIARALAKGGGRRSTTLQLDFSPHARSRRSALLRAGGKTKPHRYGFYVPGRNLIFLAHAASLAEVDEIDRIYIGSNLQDAAGTPLPGAAADPPRGGFPDASREFIAAAESALNAGLKYAGRVRIEAPLLAMPKFGAIRHGHDNELDFRWTWSCYGDGRRACGTCPACRSRLLNFHWAGLVDPLRYEFPQEAVLAKALDTGAGEGSAARPDLPRRRQQDSAAAITLPASGAIEPTLRVTVGLPGDTPSGVLDTLRRAYDLQPRRVKVSRCRHDGLPAADTDRLARMAVVSANSYNYWKQLARNVKRSSREAGKERR